MCDPVTATLAATSAYGAYKQSEAQKSQAEYQSQVAANNAIYAEKLAQDSISRGRDEEARYRQKVGGIKAKQKNAFANANVDVSAGGSVSDVLIDTDALGSLDALTIRHNAMREAYQHRVNGQNATAQSLLYQNQADSINPFLDVSTSLLGSANKFSK